MEEKLTNSDPFITSTDKHSIYPRARRWSADADTPSVDLDGRTRDDSPDLGARERGAAAPAICP